MATIAKRRNRYVLDFYDSQGNRKRKTLKAGTTKKAAKEKLREIEDQLQTGTYISDKKVPLFSVVAIDWLKHKKPNLRKSTYNVYEAHTRNHFKEFEAVKINRITTAKVETFISDRQESGMHILTLRKILVTLGQIFAYAVRHGYTGNNPLTNAERPKGQGQNKKKKMEILNPEKIKIFLDAVTDQKFKMLFRLAIFSGARQGELLGLKWSDVDWINSQIHIQRTYNHRAWYDTKTEESDRRIDLGPVTLTELKRWKIACLKSELDLVFPNQAGNPINHNNLVSRYFNPGLEDAKLPRMRFHDLRHTYASLLIEQGENIKYIQSQLGHSSPTVTLNVYAHLMKKKNQEAACRLENSVFMPSGKEVVTKWSQKEKRGLRHEP